MSAPVPAGEVFTAAQIGKALSPPTPNAGKTAPSLANAPVDDGQWTMPSKNYASTRYSAQTEITAANVATLKPAFTFPLGVAKGQEAAPIVADGMMYVVTAYPNLVFAFDLKKGDGKPVWSYTPDVLPAAQALRAAMSSTAAARSARAATFSTRWTGRRSRSTPRPARSCGRSASATSTRARP